MYDAVTVFQIQDAIKEVSIDYREKDGRYQLHHCPYCETHDTREPYKNFSFDINTGQYQCWRKNNCPSPEGNLTTFCRDFDINDKYNEIKVFSKPRPITIAPKTDLEKFYDWYEKERGINKEVLIDFNVSLMKNNRGKYIVYEYRNQDGEVFNRKYRNAANKKDMWTEKNCERDFYGKNTLTEDFKEVFICEGEDDAHALYQLGFKHNVLSVPFGAGNYTESMDKTIEGADRIYLLFDNDDAGRAGANKFALKAGFDRCKIVAFPDFFKDVREMLIKGVTKDDIVTLISFSEQARHPEIRSFDEQLIGMTYDNYTAPNNFTRTGFIELDKVTGGFAKGELVIITANTGQSKTTLAYNILDKIERTGKNILAFSFENREEQVAKKLMDVRTGEELIKKREFDPNRPFNPEESSYYSELSREAYIAQGRQLAESGWKIMDKSNSKRGKYSLEDIRRVVHDAVKYFNTEFVLIDHFHYIDPGTTENVTLAYEWLVKGIKQLAEEFGIVIFLVAHQAKTGQDKNGKQYRAGLNNIKGASAIAQEADHILISSIEGSIYEKDLSGNLKEIGVTRVTYEKSRESGGVHTMFFKVDTAFNRYFWNGKINPYEEYENTHKPDPNVLSYDL